MYRVIREFIKFEVRDVTDDCLPPSLTVVASSHLAPPRGVESRGVWRWCR